MSKRLFILDLDRTIFDTHHFFEDIKTAIHRTHRLDIDQFINTFDAYVDPLSGGYSPHRHYGDLLNITPEELDEFIIQELGNADYTFPDAKDWINAHHGDDLIVMTVGNPRYQTLKFHHCHAIRRLRKIVVATDKGAILRQHLAGTSGTYGLEFLDQPYQKITLIDDSADTFTALGQTDKIAGVRIARPGEKYSERPTPPGIRQITSFDEIGDL